MKIINIKLIYVVIAVALTSCASAKDSAQSDISDGVYVSECGYGYAQKPSSITLTCADGGMYIEAIEFSKWDDISATGTGIFSTNNCDPDCASGKMINSPVSLLLTKPIKDSAGKMIFSSLAITSKVKLYNGQTSAEFDIGIQPEGNSDAETNSEPAAKQLTPLEATNDLLGRLNSSTELWQVNEAATSSVGQMSHRRLGLYSEPDFVLECNLQWSGTWLFVYSDENAAYDALNSDYFFRTSAYSAEFTYDPITNLIVILHTSMGGKKACLDSAFSQLQYYATD